MREGRGNKFWLILAVLISLQVRGQEPLVNGGFIEDSLLIGKDVNFWISARYDPSLEMAFPDSLFSFAPFEYSSKSFFPTELKDGMAFDSTIYTIQSFEIDAVQYMKLPAYIIDGTDSIRYETPLDSIFLIELAPVVNDSTKLKSNVNYQSVDRQFNYPLMNYILGGLVLITFIVLLVFGKKIMKWIRLRRMEKQYRQFSDKFYSFISKLKIDPEPSLAEEAMIYWKKYQQRLEGIPFSVLTTQEILDNDFTSELKNPLHSIDRMIYGNKIDENIYQDFEQIETFTQDRYKGKVEEIKHGK